MTQNKIVNLVSVIFFAENLSRPILEHHLNNIHKQIYANKEIIVVYEDARTDFDDMILRYPHCKFIPSKLTPRLTSAATIAQVKKTRTGENRSAILSMAKTSVPVIKPNCTALVICAR